MMNRHRIFIIMAVVMLAVLSALIAHGRRLRTERQSEETPGKRELVRELGLTDLAVWTEARYTRHPSQADYFSPFQDCPSSLEHFPAGSVVAPPVGRWSSAGSQP